MVFMLIVLGVFLAAFIVGLIIDEEMLYYMSLVFLLIVGFLFFAFLGDSISTKNSIKDIRANPQVYSIFEKHDMNKKIKNAKEMYGTIFSFYNDFDLEYLDETN